MKQTVSFDYDETLTSPNVLEYAKSLDANILIVTQRPLAMRKDVFAAAKQLNIPISNVVFCGSIPKYRVLNNLFEDKNYTFHLDNIRISAPNTILLTNNFIQECNEAMLKCGGTSQSL